MDIKKLAPWNWFKRENDNHDNSISVKPIRDTVNINYSPHSLSGFHNEVDRMFDRFFNGFGLSGFRSSSHMLEGITGDVLNPRLDLGSTAKK